MDCSGIHVQFMCDALLCDERREEVSLPKQRKKRSPHNVVCHFAIKSTRTGPFVLLSIDIKIIQNEKNRVTILNSMARTWRTILAIASTCQRLQATFPPINALRRLR